MISGDIAKLSLRLAAQPLPRPRAFQRGGGGQSVGWDEEKGIGHLPQEHLHTIMHSGHLYCDSHPTKKKPCSSPPGKVNMGRQAGA